MTIPDYGVVTLFAAQAANATSKVTDAGRLTDDASLEVKTTGSPTFSLQLQGSIDYDPANSGAATWAALGSAVVATGVTKVSFTTTGPVRYFRAVLSSLSGGTFTALLATMPGV